MLPFLRWICFRTICYYNIRARKKIHKKHKMPRRTDAERAPGQKENAGCGTKKRSTSAVRALRLFRLTTCARKSIIKTRKGAGRTVVSSLTRYHILLENMTAEVWTHRAVIFLAVFWNNALPEACSERHPSKSSMSH